MATPVIRIQNPEAPEGRRQATLMATRLARTYREKRMTFPPPAEQLLNESTAVACAEKLLRDEGIPAPSRQQCLGKLVLPFGQYHNAPFQWLVVNDVGYLKYLVDKHRAELSKKAKIHNQWLKDYLAEYAESFPLISIVLEANIHQWIYGQKGFENHTFQEMWVLYSQYSAQKSRPHDYSSSQKDQIQKAYSSVNRWLNTAVTHITSVQMKRFRKYIYDRKDQMSRTVNDPLEAIASKSTSASASSSATPVASRRGTSTSAAPHTATSATQMSGTLNDPSWLDDTLLLEAIESESAASSTASLAASSSTSTAPRTATARGTASRKATVISPSTAGSPAPSAVTSKALSTTSGVSSSVMLSTPLPSLHESPVELEGWVRSWEDPNGIPPADLSWVKDDMERGLFSPIQVYCDTVGVFKRRRVMKSDRMWFYPPEPPGYVAGTVPSPHLFFRSRIFVWRPVGVWKYSLTCPRGKECVGDGKAVYLYKSGYHTKVRHICDISSWYSMLTEVLCCGQCTKAARSGDGVKFGRWLAWDSVILRQLSEAHQAMFPAVLTTKRGVDKNVVQLLRDRSEGNTMAKVWRQVQENHFEEYLHRKDIYTTLLMTLLKPGGIVSAFGHTFEAPPPPRELPSARLLRHAFLLAEAGNVQDYRSQILSTFGTVLKMDSTKKVVKKLSGEGKGTAEWFTSIGNEHSQIVSFVLTCEESNECLEPMCRGVMDRFERANQPAPKILYVDRGCCRAQGRSAVETLFQNWVDSGMVVRLDIFHWIHRFDAAIRTDSHLKYAVFKSALAGAVMAYNRADLELLIKAVRAKDTAAFASVSDEDMVRLYVSREQMKHHVRRLTLGAQETFRLVQIAIDELNGPAGLDESGVSLFKSPEAIDGVWKNQQRHLECIQDPPEMHMYRVARTTSINEVDVPYYKCLRGSNNLEGFHKTLPIMIPGPHCAARPYQVYLISGIARWNSDRSSDAVYGGKGRKCRVYSAPLIERLNARCQQLFGTSVEENFRAPADVASNELLGLEYLFSQSTGESGPFTLSDISQDGPSPEEEVIRPGEHDTHEEDEAYQSGTEGDTVTDRPAHITLTTDETTLAHPPAFEDACSANPLPGFRQLERFCSLLVNIGLTEDQLSLSTEQRNEIIEAWNAVDEHDKQPQKFNVLYRTHWGNTLYCRTKRDDLVEAAVTQRVKMSKRYAPAQQDISSQHNRLMYVLVKLLWLASPGGSQQSPEKKNITKAYERVQHRLLVEDPVLSKLYIPLPKINTKTVRDFIQRQERLINLRSTRMPSRIVLKTTSVSSQELPPAPCQPLVLPPPDYSQVRYDHTPSRAGTKVLKKRTDIFMLRPEKPTSSTTTPTASHSVDTSSAWARATCYKRKSTVNLTQVGTKLSRVLNFPVCSLCLQSIQGHKKYKKKNFCPVKNMSSSKGLDNTVYTSYEHFVSVVDSLQ